MNTKQKWLAGLLTLLFLTATWGAFTTEAAAEAVPDKFQGLVVSAGAGQMVLMVGTEQLMFVVTDETKITLEKRDADLEDLEKGQMAWVTANRLGDEFLALVIDAKKAVIGSSQPEVR